MGGVHGDTVPFCRQTRKIPLGSLMGTTKEANNTQNPKLN
jgi:hypothetical protein